METFYWHDYETWGINAKIDRPFQFAGIRTDFDFNIIEEPLVLYCQPPVDLLPHPEACVITNATPTLAKEKGVLEYQFAAAIHQALSKPGTCGVGYNSIRFDDEVTRHLLYRNFYDPYQREWQNGNSRWDIIDMVRACCALRPEGIEWPLNEEGKISFKLSDITQVNGLMHDSPHDALSDVYATIAIARLIKEKQPKLFEYLLKSRNKKEVIKHFDLNTKKPLLHISGMFGGERHYAALVMPLAMHASNSNEIICYDLSVDPTPLIDLNTDAVRERIFTSGTERIPLKTIRINRCPVVCTASILDDAMALRLNIDLLKSEMHYKKLLNYDLSEKLNGIFLKPEEEGERDPEESLYDQFLNDVDKYKLQAVRSATALELKEKSFQFQDKRLTELLFRYRARNFKETLNTEECEKWRAFCHHRLTDPKARATMVKEDFEAALLKVESETMRKDLLEHMYSLMA